LREPLSAVSQASSHIHVSSLKMAQLKISDTVDVIGFSLENLCVRQAVRWPAPLRELFSAESHILTNLIPTNNNLSHETDSASTGTAL
jgi:hypothetical protein